MVAQCHSREFDCNRTRWLADGTDIEGQGEGDLGRCAKDTGVERCQDRRQGSEGCRQSRRR